VCLCSCVCCAVFERGVLCCVVCLIAVPLPPGESPFAVQIIIIISNSIKNILKTSAISRQVSPCSMGEMCLKHVQKEADFYFMHQTDYTGHNNDFKITVLRNMRSFLCT
jgi:hypothetical protein